MERTFDPRIEVISAVFVLRVSTYPTMSSNSQATATFSVSSSSARDTTSSSTNPPRIYRNTGRTVAARGPVLTSSSRPDVGETQQNVNPPTTPARQAYVEKRDRELPPSGRGSSGVSAENPMEPQYEGHETFCCNMNGELIAFQFLDSKGVYRWKDARGKFCKAPNGDEWLDHECWGKDIWIANRMRNLGADMSRTGRLTPMRAPTPSFIAAPPGLNRISEDHGHSKKRAASHSAMSTRSSEVGSVGSEARSASVGSRRCFSETFGEDRGDLSQDIVFGVTEADISRKLTSITKDGTIFAEERKRVRVEICKEADESHRVAESLRNELSFMEGAVQSEFYVMNER